MAIFLRLDEIESEITTIENYLGQIEILDWSWGVSSARTPESIKGKATVDDLTVTKFTDKSTPELYRHAFAGLKIPTATLTVTRSSEQGPLKVFTIEMKGGVFVSGLQASWSDGDPALIEQVSLRFTKADTKLFRYGADDSLLGTENAKWNANKKPRSERIAPKAGPPIVSP
jgi:type VI secretion system secreted protein Hcp